MCVGGGGATGVILGPRERAHPSVIMEGSNILGIQVFQNKSGTLNKDL